MQDSADWEVDYEYAPSGMMPEAEAGLPEEAQPSRGMEISGARVLHLDGQVLIFEFEVPFAGFLLPGDGATVRVSFDDGSSCDARVQGSESSPEGPHESGLTVRLALKLEDPYSWHHGEGWLQWQEPDGNMIDLHIPLGL
jgi:hypothetical protein